MKKLAFAATLATLLLAPGATTAADLMPYGQPAPARSMFWQGPYVGANLGYQWGSVSNTGTDPSGVMGGIQAGYNWQSGQFVFGGETDLQMSDADDRFAGWKFSNPWFGTLRGRAGYAMNNILLYGTAGLAYGTLRAESLSLGVHDSRTSLGWAAGAGMEVALTGNWSARAEYLYVDLNSRTFALDGTDHGISSSMLRFGVNYRF
ncbi:outer membrane protein [Rhodoplanes sp. Z2-YC6860]|uniref:outer membrane protein n=1 Tax=Rhodoplanes sp. Z2-YC6860 TaxID=674703 RepID=UPI00078C125C|nr:outer membrane protein [Rhodoplanes sp. Z2-YC6860]AMN39910.1 outer-membrane immunogenic protein [Rhodoplanes sp. Z2-YC6860]